MNIFTLERNKNKNTIEIINIIFDIVLESICFPFSMDYRERGSHARCVYLTQGTSRMGRARVKQEKEADTRIIAEE